MQMSNRFYSLFRHCKASI